MYGYVCVLFEFVRVCLCLFVHACVCVYVCMFVHACMIVLLRVVVYVCVFVYDVCMIV